MSDQYSAPAGTGLSSERLFFRSASAGFALAIVFFCGYAFAEKAQDGIVGAASNVAIPIVFAIFLVEDAVTNRLGRLRDQARRYRTKRQTASDVDSQDSVTSEPEFRLGSARPLFRVLAALVAGFCLVFLLIGLLHASGGMISAVVASLFFLPWAAFFAWVAMTGRTVKLRATTVWLWGSIYLSVFSACRALDALLRNDLATAGLGLVLVCFWLYSGLVMRMLVLAAKGRLV